MLPIAVALEDKTSGRKNSTAIAMDECECSKSMNWNENQSSNLFSLPAASDFRKPSSSSFAMTNPTNGDGKITKSAMDGNGLLFQPAKKLDFISGDYSNGMDKNKFCNGK